MTSYWAANGWADWFPADKFDISGGITRRESEYDESQFGLQFDKIWVEGRDHGYDLHPAVPSQQ